MPVICGFRLHFVCACTYRLSSFRLSIVACDPVGQLLPWLHAVQPQASASFFDLILSGNHNRRLLFIMAFVMTSTAAHVARAPARAPTRAPTHLSTRSVVVSAKQVRLDRLYSD